MLHAARLSTRTMSSVSEASFLQVLVPSTSWALAQFLLHSERAVEWSGYVISRSC
jgi:hypothetical protein